MPKQPKDFSQAKVYKIVCNTTQEIYVGSTTKQYLSQRLTAHRATFNHWKKGKGGFVSSYPILERGNYTIELIEACPCECWDELHSREGYWIKQLDCVNQRVPGRTIQEYRMDNKEQISAKDKEYREANLDKLSEQKKIYREANLDKIKEKNRAYREANPESEKERMKAYREANQDKIKERDRAYREEHKEEYKERRKDRYQANKEVYKAKAQAYRAAKKAAQ